jgi:hypothetical protein
VIDKEEQAARLSRVADGENGQRDEEGVIEVARLVGDQRSPGVPTLPTVIQHITA